MGLGKGRNIIRDLQEGHHISQSILFAMAAFDDEIYPEEEIPVLTVPQGGEGEILMHVWIFVICTPH